MFGSKACCNIITQRHTNTSHFERVSQSVVNKDATREWEYLGLILQTTEWCRENKSVVIALKLCTVVVSFRVSMLLTETLIRYKLLPIHHNQGAKVRKIRAVSAHFAEINEKIKKLGL
jgi:membrane protein insertase Oxa1/YidC/SpoIIIJ